MVCITYFAKTVPLRKNERSQGIVKISCTVRACCLIELDCPTFASLRFVVDFVIYCDQLVLHMHRSSELSSCGRKLRSISKISPDFVWLHSRRNMPFGHSRQDDITHSWCMGLTRLSGNKHKVCAPLHIVFRCHHSHPKFLYKPWFTGSLVYCGSATLNQRS